jgi:hypothetical protein
MRALLRVFGKTVVRGIFERRKIGSGKSLENFITGNF